MTELKINDRPLETLPEIVSFENSKKELEEFTREHAAVLKQLRVLAARYNAALQAADKVIRSRKVSFRDWRLLGRPTITIDAKKYYEEMGRDFCLQHGGKTIPAEDLELDKAKVEAAYAQGLIPKDVYERIRHESPKYKKPEELDVP